jgi:Tol biopolymer transport system component
MRVARSGLLLAATATLLGVASGIAFAATGSTERVSLATDGAQGNGDSFLSSASADGRYVAFDSEASNLVVGDTNGVFDVFVRDRQSGTTERVSVSTGGSQAGGGSFEPTISADGRYVAFESAASDLFAGDSNGVFDVFVHDRQSGTTERVSVATDGTEGTDASGGRLGLSTVISGNGRFVAFESTASNLVAGDANGENDIFVRDLQAGTTERVSVASDGTEGNHGTNGKPAITADGRFVAFESTASNLVAGDTNNNSDVFVRDRQNGITERVSVKSDGTEGDLGTGGSPCFGCGSTAISPDGRYVAFDTQSELVGDDLNEQEDVFVHDRQTGSTERVSVASDGTEANRSSFTPTISADGRYVAFDSGASNLVPGDTNVRDDVFLHDRQTGSTERLSVAPDGTQGNGHSINAWMSVDGESVVFFSDSSNLVAGDTNTVSDVFMRITARSPQAQIEDLGALINSLSVADATKNSLTNKLQSAQKSLASGHVTASCNMLEGFMNQVGGFRTAGKLTATQADALTEDANQIREVLGCA